VPEMAYSREDHGHAELIGGVDDFLVVDRAARLDDRGGAGCGNGFKTVWKTQLYPPSATPAR